MRLRRNGGSVLAVELGRYAATMLTISLHVLKKNALSLTAGLGVIVPASSLNAQTPGEVREFHDSATSLIHRMSSRALTPGDTFFTWNPRPGG
jgi:hypothetical protein